MTSKSPRYAQIANYVRIHIQQNKLKRGDQLPTEAELCERFNCSRITVRQALDTLVRDGEVYRVQGAGTFVNDRVRLKKSGLLACIIPNLLNSEIARIVYSLGVTARQRGILPVLSVTNDMPELERQFIDEAARMGVHGVLKFPTNPENEQSVRQRLREYGLPCVIINDFWTDCAHDFHVAYDECLAVELAIEHLAELGHKRIAFADCLGWPRLDAVEQFFKSLTARGLPHEQHQLFLYDMTGRPPVENLFDGTHPHPTAIITAFDVLANQIITQLRKLELRVPQDVSVVNISGKPVEPVLDIDLTTAVPPNQQIVERALDLLADHPAGVETRQFSLKPDFYIGGSTAPCPGDAQSVRVPRETPAVRSEVSSVRY